LVVAEEKCVKCMDGLKSFVEIVNGVLHHGAHGYWELARERVEDVKTAIEGLREADCISDVRAKLLMTDYETMKFATKGEGLDLLRVTTTRMVENAIVFTKEKICRGGSSRLCREEADIESVAMGWRRATPVRAGR